MLLTNLRKYCAVLGLLAAGLLLAGCGGGKPVAVVTAERSIFTSALDCEAAGKFSIDVCSATIEAAVAAHDKTAPSYKSIDSCETAEGKEKCERIGENLYRPRLSAFLITASTPPVAAPLYLTRDGQPGFRTADKQNILAKDETLIFSKSARQAFEGHTGGVKKKGMF